MTTSPVTTTHDASGNYEPESSFRSADVDGMRRQAGTPTKAWSPLGGTVPVVRSIPRRSSFQFGYDGFDFYMIPAGAVVAVAR